MGQAAQATGLFQVEQRLVNSQADEYTKLLAQNKLGLKGYGTQLAGVGKTMKMLAAEQAALAKTSVTSFGTDAQGRTMASIFSPKPLVDFGKKLEWNAKNLGLFGQVLKSQGAIAVNWGKNMQWAGRQLTVGLSVPMAAVGAIAGVMAFQVNTEMTKIQKVYDFTTSSMSDQAAEFADLRAKSFDNAKTAAEQYGASITDTLDVESKFAAMGLSGNELLGKTTETMRFATLGEFDYQTALTATVALQSIFKYNASDLGDAINYMNAAENGTILTMEDFATAIPIAAGPVKLMGGDIKTLGILMTAMKSQGISASQGANAIKSAMTRLYRPSKQVQDEFQALTDKSLPKLIADSNGKLIPMLQSLAAATDDLSRTDKIKVLGGIFGTYQVARLTAIMKGVQDLGDATTATGQAAVIAGNSVQQNAQIAQKELEVWQNSISAKFKIAIQTLKAQFAEIGPIFLEVGTILLKAVAGIAQAFNELPNGVKLVALLGAGLLALAGPVLMLVGLFTNLYGQALKLGGSVLTLATRFNLLEKDSVVANKLREITTQEDVATKATLTLVDAQLALAASFREAAIASELIAPPGKYAAPYSATQEASIIGPAGRHALYDPADVKNSAAIAENTGKASVAMKGMVSGAAMGVGMIGMMATESGSWQNNMFLGVTALGLFPGLLVKIGALLGAMATKAIAFTTALVGPTIMNSLKGMGAALAAMGPALAVGLGVGLVAWYAINKEIDATKEKMDNVNNSAQTFADILGYTYKEAATFTTQSGQVLFKTDAAEKFLKDLEKNKPDIIQFWTDLATESSDITATALSEATYQAMQTLLSGGSRDDAITVIQGVYRTMGQYITRQQASHKLTVMIGAKADKKSADKAITVLAAEAAKRIGPAMENVMGAGTKESIGRAILGSGTMDAADAEALKGYIQQWYNAFGAATASGNTKLQQKMVIGLHNSFVQPFKDLKAELAAQDVLTPGTTIGDLMAGNGIEAGGEAAFGDRLNALRDSMKNITQDLEAANPGLKTYLENNQSLVSSLFQLKVIGPTAYANLMQATGQGSQVDLQSLAQGYNSANAAVEGFGKGADDAAPKIDKLTNSVNNQKKAMDAYNSISWKDTWKGVMTDTQQSISDTLMSKFDQNMQAAIDSVAAAWQKKLDQFDAMRAKQEKKWDKKQTQLDNQQQNATDALTAQFDKRRAAITAYYDSQTKHVNDAISAEQRAEEIRQAIFDNEEKRLQRLADEANATIDFNVALNSGNLDEAARIRNDQAAAEAQNNLTDAADVADKKSQKRLDHLNTILDKIEKLKQKKLDALDALEKKEQKMLEKEQARQDAELARERDHWEKMMDIRAKALQAQADAANKAAQDEWDLKKETLQKELDALMTFIPRNEEQLRRHVDRLKALYSQYGGDLKISGKEWGKIIGDALHDNVTKAAQGLRSDINWSHIGKQTAQDFLMGAFGMTRAQFMKFLGIQVKQKGPKGILSGPVNSIGNIFHSGGLVGDGGGRRPKNAPFMQDEVPALLKKKEFVMQESAVAQYGPGFMEALNRGKVEGLGGPEGAGAKGKKGHHGPALHGDAIGMAFEGVVAQMMAQYMQGGAVAFVSGIMQSLPGHFTAGHPGHYGDMDFDKGQMKIAQIIASVGKGMHMTRRDILTGLVTGITESTLHNYAGGDGSSIGVFQQTDPWGSAAQRHDPAWASKKFYQALKQIDSRDGMSIGQAAQAVQRSAYPGRYQTHVDEAKAILAAMSYHAGSTGPGGPAPGATPRGQRAIDWATAQAHQATRDWYYKCLTFVRSAFGVGSMYGNAASAWQGAKYKHRQTPGAAPPGVPLWWGGGDGHVALSLGNGNIISSDWPKAHDVGFATAKDITQGWGKPYYGWTEDINGVKIYKHNAPGLLKGGTIRYDNTMINAHKNEKVLTAPLSKSLETGIQRMETHGGDTFNIEINVAPGEPVDAKDLARKMMKAIDREKSRSGYDRWVK